MEKQRIILQEANEQNTNIFEIPGYGLRAYALFYTKYGLKYEFSQKELDWIVSDSMKKKIFALLLKAGWIEKRKRNTYVCINPQKIFQQMLISKIPYLIKNVKKDYCFTGLSAIEIWSDYSYVQRSWEKSPYFIKVLKKDLKYWQKFFNFYNIPNYLNFGSTIGEYVILLPVENLEFTVKEDIKVEKLQETIRIAKANNVYLYAYNYMKKKYG